MGKLYEGIDERLSQFIAAQKMYFVATAPLAGDGLLNLSPKGLDSFRILGPKTVAYLDLVGSGVETIAHLRENGRIVILFCAFEGPPKIVRLHGRGESFEPGDREYDTLAPSFPERPNARAIIRIHVERISDSCGFGVPLYQFEGERTQLDDWADRKGPEGIARYKVEKNSTSLDGLPGLLRLGEEGEGRSTRSQP
ncbi:pyridoxamine 5'-phosphate oxidase family protein [Pendulispora rubella]|uniref:Pyridoxamine 5'-phosphate oxidase family protein n=1 Tax=Pendulispora rubella TaxID=2741070 RepID=A0ABZ2KRX2_9BACT